MYLLMDRRFGITRGKPLKGICGAPSGSQRNGRTRRPPIISVKTRQGKIIAVNRHHLAEDFEEKQEIKRWRRKKPILRAARQARKLNRGSKRKSGGVPQSRRHNGSHDGNRMKSRSGVH